MNMQGSLVEKDEDQNSTDFKKCIDRIELIENENNEKVKVNNL